MTAGRDDGGTAGGGCGLDSSDIRSIGLPSSNGVAAIPSDLGGHVESPRSWILFNEPFDFASDKLLTPSMLRMALGILSVLVVNESFDPASEKFFPLSMLRLGSGIVSASVANETFDPDLDNFSSPPMLPSASQSLTL
jgi:hypothetical protein